MSIILEGECEVVSVQDRPMTREEFKAYKLRCERYAQARHNQQTFTGEHYYAQQKANLDELLRQAYGWYQK